MRYYNYMIKAIYKSRQIKDNKAERLYELQNILRQILKQEDIDKNKVDKFKDNLAKIIK